MEVVPTIPKPTIEEIASDESLQTNPLPYNGPELIRAEEKDFDDEEMIIQGLTKKIVTLKSWTSLTSEVTSKRMKKKMRKRKRNESGLEQRGPFLRNLPRGSRKRNPRSR